MVESKRPAFKKAEVLNLLHTVAATDNFWYFTILAKQRKSESQFDPRTKWCEEKKTNKKEITF